MSPIRIQLSRKRGWKKPANTVVVLRPSKWGNKIPVPAHSQDQKAQAHSVTVELYAAWLDLQMFYNPRLSENIRKELAGKNLACWCPLHVACHADVLLKIANSKT